MSDLDDAQRAALIDARCSLNSRFAAPGGLHLGFCRTLGDSRGLVWMGVVGVHASDTIQHLVGLGLLTVLGDWPADRFAHITEEGLLELDCAGAAT